MAKDRLDTLRKMLDKRPGDPKLRFGVALELLNRDRLEEGVEELQRYLASAEDEGNAWGRLGEALKRLGREEEAREAYRTGIDAAYRHGHPTMAEEFEEILEGWG